MPAGSIADGAAVVQLIVAYSESIRDVRPGLSCCPKCHELAEGPAFFRRHEIRRRVFWVIFDTREVKRIPCLVTRWKCSNCRGVFTWQPPFAVPHKRYTLPQMLERAQGYAADDAAGYREAVKQKGMPICHEERVDEAQRETAGDPIQAALCEACEEVEREDGTGKQLSHATLYRWITTLGGLTRTVQCALVLIRQASAAVAFFRSLAQIRILPGKYRSESRKEILRRCRVLDRVKAKYEEMFTANLFPFVATAFGWT